MRWIVQSSIPVLGILYCLSFEDQNLLTLVKLKEKAQSLFPLIALFRCILTMWSISVFYAS